MIINMEKPNKNCQSCGIFLRADSEGRGTNANGSHSSLYCSKCYQHGEFIEEDIDTSEKMRMSIKNRLQKRGFPTILADLFTRDIPRLKRWADLNQKIRI